jgi:hypothetical protein
MLGYIIELKVKHVIIIVLIFLAYWYVIDKANKPNFKNDVEKMFKSNISEDAFSLIKDKTHTITGVLCMAAGIIMNGLPVYSPINHFFMYN